MMDWAANALSRIGSEMLPAALGIEHLGLFVAAGIVLNLTPGVDVLYILTQAVKGGGRAGVAAALGIVAGCFLHIAAAAMGLSALIAASGAAFGVLKGLGAPYLMWVGWQLLRSQGTSLSVALSADLTRAAAKKDLIDIFARGFWTNALHSKWRCFFWRFCRSSLTRRQRTRHWLLCCWGWSSISTACGSTWALPGWGRRWVRLWVLPAHHAGARYRENCIGLSARPGSCSSALA